MEPIVEKALEVADAAIKSWPPTDNVKVNERFQALDVLRGEVRRLSAVDPVPPKTCHCRSTWADFSTANDFRFHLGEIERQVGELLTGVGATGKKAGNCSIPETVIECLREIERRAHVARPGPRT